MGNGVSVDQGNLPSYGIGDVRDAADWKQHDWSQLAEAPIIEQPSSALWSPRESYNIYNSWVCRAARAYRPPYDIVQSETQNLCRCTKHKQSLNHWRTWRSGIASQVLLPSSPHMMMMMNDDVTTVLTAWTRWFAWNVYILQDHGNEISKLHILRAIVVYIL